MGVCVRLHAVWPQVPFRFYISFYSFSRYLLTVRLSCVNFPTLFKLSFTLLLPVCSKFRDQTKMIHLYSPSWPKKELRGQLTFIEYLLCGGHITSCFATIISFFHNSLVSLEFLSPLYRCVDWGSESLSNIPRVTQLPVSVRARIQTWCVSHRDWPSVPHCCGFVVSPQAVPYGLAAH